MFEKTYFPVADIVSWCRCRCKRQCWVVSERRSRSVLDVVCHPLIRPRRAPTTAVTEVTHQLLQETTTRTPLPPFNEKQLDNLKDNGSTAQYLDHPSRGLPPVALSAPVSRAPSSSQNRRWSRRCPGNHWTAASWRLREAVEQPHRSQDGALLGAHRKGRSSGAIK